MMDTYQVVLGALAVLIMVMVPIGCVLLWDLLAGRWDESLKRFRERQVTSAEHRRTLRALRRIHARLPDGTGLAFDMFNTAGTPAPARGARLTLAVDPEAWIIEAAA